MNRSSDSLQIKHFVAIGFLKRIDAQGCGRVGS
jgi:hypothetical protein